jgi:sortase A
MSRTLVPSPTRQMASNHRRRHRNTVPVKTVALRFVGHMFIAMGAVLLLYLLHSLLVTGLTTRQAQASLRQAWELHLTDGLFPDADGGFGDETPEPIQPGEAVAVLQFARPGSLERPVQNGPLYVVEGVGVEDLKKGPGHYSNTAMPGERGNFAVAGHRTTYGNPFFNLDDLRQYDEIYVTDRQGTQWVYAVVRQEIVSPHAERVLKPDPLGTGRPTLTLTTCHPRFSNAQRLVVFAELQGATISQTPGGSA